MESIMMLTDAEPKTAAHMKRTIQHHDIVFLLSQDTVNCIIHLNK